MSSFLYLPLLLLLASCLSHTILPHHHRSSISHHHNHHRQLDSHIDTAGYCHDIALNASSIHLDDKLSTGQEQLSSTYGMVFMLSNTDADLDGISATVTITGLSIYLDGTTGVNYTVYVVDDTYITMDEESGQRFSMLGGKLGEDVEPSSDENIGWYRHGSGYIDENNMNADGMSVLMLKSPIIIKGEETKSIYIKLSSVDLCVMETYDDGMALVPESVDETVVFGEGFDRLKIHVGRGILLDSWASGLPEVIFDQMYPPRRFLGNLYVNVDYCTKTVRNSYFDLYSIGDTQTRDNYFRVMKPFRHMGIVTDGSLEFEDSDGGSNGIEGSTFQNTGIFKRRLQTNTTTTTGCFDTATVYPVIEGEMKKVATKYYNQNLPSGVQVNDVKYKVKADKEIWSAEGGCNNLRFILDEEFVYSIDDPEKMILSEISAAPWGAEDNREEMLQNFKANEVYFARFGSMDGPHVTDARLTTRMPSSKPSVAPSTSLSPSMFPSETVSDSPSVFPSMIPSNVPSTFPSAYPSDSPVVTTTTTTTAAVTEDPIDPPTYFPTEMEELFIIKTTVPFNYDIWYPPERYSTSDIKGFIIGNVTNAFRNTLFSDVPLKPLVQEYELDLSIDTDPPIVEVEVYAQDLLCVTDDLPENDNNICQRFTLSLTFRHRSDLPSENARFWILRVSDRSGGNLKSSITGLKSVKSDQLLTFEDATSEPSPEEEKVLCDVLTETLNSTLSSSNYTVTHVECLDFEFIPYETQRKKKRLFSIRWPSLRRRLQQNGGGDLNIYYNIEAEYPMRAGQVDFMADGFDDIIEDSINRGAVAKEMKEDLAEREIAVVENAVAEAKTVQTPAPTPYPTSVESESDADPTVFGEAGTSEILSSSRNTTGTVLAVVFSLIVLFTTFGMYFYYVYFIRVAPKDDYSEYSYSEDEYYDEPSLLDDDVYKDEERRMSMNMESLAPAAATHIFDDYKKRVEQRSNLNNGDDYDERVRRKSLLTNDDGYNERVRRKSSLIIPYNNDDDESSNDEKMIIDIESMRRLRTFESNLTDSFIDHPELENQQNTTQSIDKRIKRSFGPVEEDEVSHQSRQRSIDSLDEKIRKKMGYVRGRSKKNGALDRSMKSVDSFEERISSKIADGNPNEPIPSDISFVTDASATKPLKRFESLSSIDSFERRLQDKLANDSGTASQSRQLKSASSMSNLGSYEDRVKQKLAKEGASAKPPRELKSADSVSSIDSFEQRIQDKLTKDRGTASQPIKRSESLSSIDSFQQRIQDKLAKDRGTSSPSRQLKTASSMSSLGSYEDRVKQKLAKEGASAKPPRELKSSDSVSSIDSFEQRIQDKLAKDRRTSSQSRQLKTASSMSSLGSYEDRVKQKLAKERAAAKPLKPLVELDSFSSVKSLDSFEQRIQEKLVREGASAKPSRELKSASSMSKIDSLEDRIKQKLAKDGASTKPSRELDSSSSVKSLDSFEQRIQEKLATDSSNVPRSIATPKSATSGASYTFEDRLQRKTAKDKAHSSMHVRSSSNVSTGSFEDRLQQKLARDNAAAAATSSSANAAAPTPGVKQVASNTFEDRLQRKIAKDNAHSSMHVISSFEDRIQQKMNKDYASRTASSGSEDSFQGKIKSTTFSRKSSGDTMDALESNVLTREKSSDGNKIPKKIDTKSYNEQMSSIDTADALESNVGAKPKALDSTFDSRLEKKLQEQKIHSSNASVDSEASQRSQRSQRSVASLSRMPSDNETSFKLKLKSQLAQAKGVDIKPGDDLSLEEKIKIKKAKSSSSGEKRGKRRHKSKKDQTD